jgi:hypothetical protein
MSVSSPSCLPHPNQRRSRTGARSSRRSNVASARLCSTSSQSSSHTLSRFGHANPPTHLAGAFLPGASCWIASCCIRVIEWGANVLSSVFEQPCSEMHRAEQHTWIQNCSTVTHSPSLQPRVLLCLFSVRAYICFALFMTKKAEIQVLNTKH